MSFKSTATSFCKFALTVTSLTIAAVMAVPSPVLSLPGINIPSIPSVPSDLGDLINGGNNEKKPETEENDNNSDTSTDTTNTTTTTEPISESEKRYGENIILDHHLRITYKGVRYSSVNSTWNYKLEAIGNNDLGYLILELPKCTEPNMSSPQGEFVKYDYESRIRGIKWQLGKSPLNKEFSVTVNNRYKVGTVNVAMKGKFLSQGKIPGPSCNPH